MTALSAIIADPEARVSDTIDIGKKAYANIDLQLNSAPDGHTNNVHSDPFEWSEEAYQLRDVIADLAGLDGTRVNESVSILELGLDSIDAVKISSRLRRIGVALSVSSIMRNLNIAKMMTEISRADDTDAPTKNSLTLDELKARLIPLLPSSFCPLPATPLQEAMIAELMNSRGRRYLNHDVLRINPGVDVARLQDAWQDVVNGSPILRTSFAEVEDPHISITYAQLVHQSSKISWKEVQISSEQNVDNVLAEIREDVMSHFNVKPPFRLTLARSHSDSYIVLSMAHALYDGWSLGLLHDDVRHAYVGDYKARSSYEGSLALILNGSNDQAERFWLESLKDAPLTHFPTRKHISDLKITHRQERASSVAVADIRSLCKSLGITPQTLGQTCWSFVLASYTCSLDVVYGMVLSGRNTESGKQR